MITTALCKLFTALGLHGALIEAACSTRTATDTSATGCGALEIKFPGKTFYPGDSVYEYEAQEFWSNTELLNPTCIFRPESASDVAAGITLGRETETDFAVRGGGHMGIKVCV